MGNKIWTVMAVSVLLVLSLFLVECAQVTSLPTPAFTPTPVVVLTPRVTTSPTPAPKEFSATITGRLTGLSSFQGAAGSRIATLRAVRPETGEIAAAVILKESFDYQVKVPPRLYLLIAGVVDPQSGKEYLGFSRVLRMNADDTRQLDLLMEPSVVTRQPSLPIGHSLSKKRGDSYHILPRLVTRRALTTPHIVSEATPDGQPSTQGKRVVIAVGDFTLSQGPEVPVEINNDLAASDVTVTELFKAIGDKYDFLDTSSASQEGIRRELELQKAGLIRLDTMFEYRPLTPDYEVRGRVRVDGVYITGAGDLSITLELVDKKTGQILVTHTAAAKGKNIRDFFALTAVGIESESDFKSKIIAAIKQQEESRTALPTATLTPVPMPTPTPTRTPTPQPIPGRSIAVTFSGAPYTVSQVVIEPVTPISSATISYNMKMDMTVIWQGNKGSMKIPTSYSRELISGLITFVGVTQDSNTFEGALTDTNDMIMGTATTTFQSGEGSFPATAKFEGRISTDGRSITGVLSIVSELVTQSVPVVLNMKSPGF